MLLSRKGHKGLELYYTLGGLIRVPALSELYREALEAHLIRSYFPAFCGGEQDPLDFTVHLPEGDLTVTWLESSGDDGVPLPWLIEFEPNPGYGYLADCISPLIVSSHLC